ncbi:sigma 54-interacting transcriptional regulator [Congregibacter brevis]|uniref:Sigma 54-interacting transcriptional regulator n=1 Tax=Congregibacter brevis TaxID=3081201 RepID=A0ABZ0IA02_9GAMM|nr:sigma 54-interacting transcriptional regulator [Congregibacter sp. IMCC45268]
MSSRARILLIGYRKFSELINSVLPDYKDEAEIIIVESVASGSVDYQALVKEHKPDVIASAGSNAAFLQNSLKLPVIAQPVTDTDIVDAVARARRIAERVHVFTYAAAPESEGRLFTALPALLGGNLQHESYATTDEAAEKLLAMAAARSADVVVGPSYICELATRRGLPAVLIYSRESARSMLDEALRQARVRSAERDTAQSPGRFVIDSPQMSRVAELARTYSRGSASVLLQGESGTGKEHIAREIHQASDYRNGALVAINCGSIPNELFESELFGYVDGAFTSSRRGGRVGLVEQANGGVLYLDEVGEMPLSQQVKLLRVLQERSVRPVGSTRELPLDFKVIAATNADLQEAVDAGQFRDDLYYRLNVFTLRLPPLRERPEDVEAIAEHYLAEYARQYEVELDVATLMAQLTGPFLMYRWPGNVRELQNFAERLAVNAAQGVAVNELKLEELLPELSAVQPTQQLPAGLLKEQECRAIAEAMQRFAGDKNAVSKELGISPTTLWRRLKEMDLNQNFGTYGAGNKKSNQYSRG